MAWANCLMKAKCLTAQKSVVSATITYSHICYHLSGLCPLYTSSSLVHQASEGINHGSLHSFVHREITHLKKKKKTARDELCFIKFASMANVFERAKITISQIHGQLIRFLSLGWKCQHPSDAGMLKINKQLENNNF